MNDCTDCPDKNLKDCNGCPSERISAMSAAYREGDVSLIRQGAEAAARAKMFVMGINRPDLVSHYSNLDSELSALADRIER